VRFGGPHIIIIYCLSVGFTNLRPLGPVRRGWHSLAGSAEATTELTAVTFRAQDFS
jgi:hypothetical protein